MLSLRKATDRGHFNHGWLDTKHSFSFGQYFDPQHMGFRALRVINEDIIAPDSGFGTHPHKDMEILTYVTEGSLHHKDSLGKNTVIKSGDFQRMTAGTGVRHSEFNPSPSTQTRLLQIWIQPSESGLEPSYEQISAPRQTRANSLRKIASSHGSKDTLQIHQDVEIYALALDNERTHSFHLAPRRHLWIQTVNGSWDINGVSIKMGDGVQFSDSQTIELRSQCDGGELLIFDLP